MMEYILLKHYTKNNRTHYDLRIKIEPNVWLSFAIPKNVALLETTKNLLAIKTQDHTDSCAVFSGEITDGYGKGTLVKIEEGQCGIVQHTPTKIVVKMFGNVLNGYYSIHRFNQAQEQFLITKQSNRGLIKLIKEKRING